MPSRARKVFAGKGCRYCREKRTVHLRFRVMQASVRPTALEITVDTAAPATPICGKPKKPLIRMALPATFRRFMETESTTTSFSRV